MICRSDDLKRAVGILAPMAAKEGFQRALTNLHFMCDGDVCRISASDGQALATVTIPCTAEEKYPVTAPFLIPAKLFSALLRSVTADTLYFRVRGDSIRFTHGKSYATYAQALDASIFIFDRDAQLRTQGAIAQISIPALQLRNAIALCAPCCSTDATQPKFSGVAFMRHGEVLRVEASDRTMLARYTIPLSESGNSFVFIVPSSHVDNLVRGANDADTVTMTAYHSQCKTECKDFVVYSPLINTENWPPTEPILQTAADFGLQLQDDLQTLAAVVHRCGFTMDAITPDIVLQVGRDLQTTMSAHGEGVSGVEALADSVVAADVPPPLGDFYFDLTYSHGSLQAMLKAFQSCGDAAVRIGVSKAVSHVLSVIGNSSHICLIAKAKSVQFREGE